MDYFGPYDEVEKLIAPECLRRFIEENFDRVFVHDTFYDVNYRHRDLFAYAKASAGGHLTVPYNVTYTLHVNDVDFSSSCKDYMSPNSWRVFRLYFSDEGRRYVFGDVTAEGAIVTMDFYHFGMSKKENVNAVINALKILVMARDAYIAGIPLHVLPHTALREDVVNKLKECIQADFEDIISAIVAAKEAVYKVEIDKLKNEITQLKKTSMQQAAKLIAKMKQYRFEVIDVGDSYIEFAYNGPTVHPDRVLYGTEIFPLPESISNEMYVDDIIVAVRFDGTISHIHAEGEHPHILLDSNGEVDEVCGGELIGQNIFELKSHILESFKIINYHSMFSNAASALIEEFVNRHIRKAYDDDKPSDDAECVAPVGEVWSVI